jgi:hypothetical protein
MGHQRLCRSRAAGALDARARHTPLMYVLPMNRREERCPPPR